MPTNVLARHTRTVTSDLAEARAEIGTAFCRHELSTTDPRGRLDVVHNAASVAGVGINYLRYGTQVRITPVPFETFYLVQIPLAGRAQVRVVASDPHYASLPSPTEPADMIWSADCEQLMIYLDRGALEALASSKDPGSTPAPVVFDPLVNLNAPALRGWLRLVRLAREELEDGAGLFGSAMTATHFEQVLLSGLLAAQPNNSGLAIGNDPVTASRTVRSAVELIEAYPERPWRVAELAAEVGVSSRTLQETFQRERGVSPLGELRRTRLARARADLSDGSPESVTVTDVAMRWGFFHLGRFSRAYREAYAEAPSQTLRR